MGIFKKKDSGSSKNLPTTIFQKPSFKVYEGFKGDSEIPEPIIRLSKYVREGFGLKRGEHVILKKNGRLIKAKVEVSSASDEKNQICRLNKASRDLLLANVGDEIEIMPPESLILLIDTSGSMADYISGIVKIEAAKNAVREFIRSKYLMGQDDKVGIVSFGAFATIIERISTNYEYLENRVDSLIPNGATAMYEGLGLSIDILTNLDGAKRIILLTDGIPTTTSRFSIITLAKKAREKMIVIDTIGVGSPFDFMSYDEGLLRRIAEITGGTFKRILDIGQLSREFIELAEGKNYTYLLPEK